MELKNILRHGWVNIYRGHTNTPARVNGFVHRTEHEAKEVGAMHGNALLATVRVEWMESE